MWVVILKTRAVTHKMYHTTAEMMVKSCFNMKQRTMVKSGLRLCSPRTNAASACKGPLCQYSIPRGDRCPNQDARIFRGLSYVKIRVFTLGEPTRAPNSRIYDVGGLYVKVRKVRGYTNPCSMSPPGWSLPHLLNTVAPGRRIVWACEGSARPHPPGVGAAPRSRFAANDWPNTNGCMATHWNSRIVLDSSLHWTTKPKNVTQAPMTVIFW